MRTRVQTDRIINIMLTAAVLLAVLSAIGAVAMLSVGLPATLDIRRQTVIQLCRAEFQSDVSRADREVALATVLQLATASDLADATDTSERARLTKELSDLRREIRDSLVDGEKADAVNSEMIDVLHDDPTRFLAACDRRRA